MKRMSKLSLVVLGSLFVGLATNAHAATLRVALYPYVPRYGQFKAVIEQKWKAIEPAVGLDWVPPADWDGGYEKDPQASFDVYVFDAINLDYFRTHQWLLGLQPTEVDNFADLLSYAAAGVQSGGLVYAIPQLGCGDILFYKKADGALAKAATLSEVTAALTSCTYYGEAPPQGTGLMVDLAGGTTRASTYVEGEHGRLNQFPVPLPQSPAQVNRTSIAAIQKVMASASIEDALYSGDNDYQRAAWFNSGLGRAYIGFTESMSQLDPSVLEQIAFKPMPWSDNTAGNGSPLFYSDVIGVHPATVGRGTRDLAVKLANLMASTEVIVASFGPYQGKGPQYLMAVRHSAFQALGADYPIYKDLYAMVGGVTPILFNLGADSKTWLGSMKAAIGRLIIADPACYTDFEAGPIMSNVAAQTVCPATCSTHGGWSGQWTTTRPGVMSVCGCNTPRR